MSYKEEIKDTWKLSDADKKQLDESEVLICAIDEDSYDGSAFVMFRHDGKLYEVNDSHCSCNGWENWSPEETTKEALAIRQPWQVPESALKHVLESL